MSPLTDTPTILPDRDVERERGSSGSRIRCPLCGWSPRKDDRWFYACGYEWNAFESGGVCPACLHQWTETQYLFCIDGRRIRLGTRSNESAGAMDSKKAMIR